MENEQKSKFLSSELVKAIIGMAICIILSYFKEEIKTRFNLNFIQDDFFRDKFKEGSILVLSSIIYFIAINMLIKITRLATKPIKIGLKLLNRFDDDDNTKIIHFSDPNKDDDIQREIKAIMQVYRTNSFWNWLALKILKNKNVEIFIHVESNDGEIICQPCSQTHEFQDYGYSFGVKIYNLCISNLEHGAYFRKEFSFLVAENRDKPCSGNCMFPIVPRIRVNGKELNFIYKRFINLDNDLKKGYYPVKYSLYSVER